MAQQAGPPCCSRTPTKRVKGRVIMYGAEGPSAFIISWPLSDVNFECFSESPISPQSQIVRGSYET